MGMQNGACRRTSQSPNANRDPQPSHLSRAAPARPCPGLLRSPHRPPCPPARREPPQPATLVLRQKQTPAGTTNITWNERSKQVKSSSPTEDTKPLFPEGEEVPAFPSAKAKLKLPVDVKGQQFPLHPCHVQVTRHALRASRLVRTIHLIASNALNLDIRKQTLGISRT